MKKHFVTYLLLSLVKLVLSRNFCQKRVRVNFRNLHISTHSGFIQLFSLFHETFSGESELFYFPHTAHYDFTKYFKALISSYITITIKVYLASNRFYLLTRCAHRYPFGKRIWLHQPKNEHIKAFSPRF